MNAVRVLQLRCGAVSAEPFLDGLLELKKKKLTAVENAAKYILFE